VFLKKGNRPKFLRQLRKNLEAGLARRSRVEGIRVAPFHGRYEVRKPGGLSAEECARAVEVLAATFGVVSVSPAVQVPNDLAEITRSAVEAARDALSRREAKTFRVAASRSYKLFPMTSPDINVHVGRAVKDAIGLPVKLAAADLTVGIEVTPAGTYVFADTARGPGGLPVGSAGRAVLLLSGGIDSPVAGWMMAKRGCQVVAIHFHSYPYTSRGSQEKVVALAERLSEWLGPVRLVLVGIGALQEMLRQRVPREQLVLFYRRSMVRLAARLAGERRARALITGESLGQVASQTMENIGVIQEATALPVLRPLIGMDKEETVRLARRIGTYDLSIAAAEDCCSLFLPPHPMLRGDVEAVKRIEAELPDLVRLEEEAWSSRVIVEPGASLAAA
jgi:thiamine biosynthesis protein ThiI